MNAEETPSLVDVEEVVFRRRLRGDDVVVVELL